MTDKTRGRLAFGMQTELLTNLVTNHARKIDFIKPNETLEVIDISVDGRTSRITADYNYEEMN